MTGDQTWIHSTRIEGAVQTWVTFKNVQPEIPDSVIGYYALLFRKTCSQGVPPAVWRDKWPKEK